MPAQLSTTISSQQRDASLATSTRLVGLCKGDAVGLEVPPARHLARAKPAAQLLANPGEGRGGADGRGRTLAQSS